VAALQGMVANHRKVRRSRVGVLSVAEKARLRSCQVWARKASESESLMKRRNALLTSKPRTVGIFGMKPEGYLFTALAVSGVKGTRAWSGRWYGTWEPVVPIVRSVQLGAGLPPWPEEGELQADETVRGRVPMRSTGTDRLVVALMPGNAGGAKETGHPDWWAGQPLSGGMSR
jgi:hypothetical protein